MGTTETGDRTIHFEKLYYASMEAGRAWKQDPSKKMAFTLAMKGFEEIIAGPEDLPFKGGAYVNWAGMETNRLITSNMNAKYDFLIPESKKVESYYNKALEIKPENEQAMQGLGIYYFAIQQFEASYDCYSQLTDPQGKAGLLNYYSRGDINYGYYLRGKNLEALKDPRRIRFYERLYNDHKTEKSGVQVGYLLVHYYEVSRDFKKSYKVMNELINTDANTEFKIIIYEKLTKLCTKGFLDKPEESVEYAKAGLELLNSRTPGEDPKVEAGLKQVEKALETYVA